MLEQFRIVLRIYPSAIRWNALVLSCFILNDTISMDNVDVLWLEESVPLQKSKELVCQTDDMLCLHLLWSFHLVILLLCRLVALLQEYI